MLYKQFYMKKIAAESSQPKQYSIIDKKVYENMCLFNDAITTVRYKTFFWTQRGKDSKPQSNDFFNYEISFT